MATGAHAALAERLLRHGLMAEPQIHDFFGRGTLPSEPERVADELVRRGFLSAYQAVHLLSDELHLLELGGYRLLEPIGSGGMGGCFSPSRSRWTGWCNKLILTFAASEPHCSIQARGPAVAK